MNKTPCIIFKGRYYKEMIQQSSMIRKSTIANGNHIPSLLHQQRLQIYLNVLQKQCLLLLLMWQRAEQWRCWRMEGLDDFLIALTAVMVQQVHKEMETKATDFSRKSPKGHLTDSNSWIGSVAGSALSSSAFRGWQTSGTLRNKLHTVIKIKNYYR